MGTVLFLPACRCIPDEKGRCALELRLMVSVKWRKTAVVDFLHVDILSLRTKQSMEKSAAKVALSEVKKQFCGAVSTEKKQAQPQF